MVAKCCNIRFYPQAILLITNFLEGASVWLSHGWVSQNPLYSSFLMNSAFTTFAHLILCCQYFYWFIRILYISKSTLGLHVSPMLFLKNERAKRQQRFSLCLFLALAVQSHRASFCSWLAHPCNCPNPWSSWRMPGVISRRIWGFVWAFCMIPFVFNCIFFVIWMEGGKRALYI